MKKQNSLLLLSTSLLAISFHNQAQAWPKIDWSQPPVGCVEEMVPSMPDQPCLDLSGVANSQKDWPANLSPEDKKYWYSHRRFIAYCRAKELLNREAATPGSQNAGQVENSWMIAESVNNSEAKVNAIYNANKAYGVPPQILTGALYQESLLMELGIADDGGNFSCGIGQVNITEWCHWANTQPAAKKKAMGWPQDEVDCDSGTPVEPKYLRPFYEIAKTRLDGDPEYKLLKKHFANIPYEAVVSGFPAAPEETQRLRYQTTRSFIDNCSDVNNGIMAKANELRNLYNDFIPKALKDKDRYQGSQRFNRSCKAQPKDNAYPLHTGWLLAVGAYNAGPRAIEALAYYNKWDRSTMNDPAVWNGFYPDKMIESLYWGGKYNKQTDLMDFKGFNGAARSWIWFKGCVVQRHVARVVQHVTYLPEFFVDSLENDFPCRKSVFDNGKLVKSGVPPFRQTSSGQIEDGNNPALNPDDQSDDNTVAAPQAPAPTPARPRPAPREESPNPFNPFNWF